MKKKAQELQTGDSVNILGKIWVIRGIEISDIGKQGSKKCRLELESKGEKMVIIRPADYPFELS